MRKILFLVALLICLEGTILEFDDKVIDLIFKKKEPCLLLLASSDETSTKALEAFKELDKTSPVYNLAVSTPTDGHDLFEKLGSYLGLDANASPQFLFLNSKTEKYLFTESEFSSNSLIAFVQDIESGKISQFLKSDPIPEDDDHYVKVVVGKNFKEVVMDTEKEVLVKFYAPWCGHCTQLAPHYEKAAELLAKNTNILLVKVDSTKNEVAGIEIEGFPTLKFFGKDKSIEPITFEGARSTEGILEWLREKTEYDWVDTPVINSEEL